jgi:hypothetical protein
MMGLMNSKAELQFREKDNFYTIPLSTKSKKPHKIIFCEASLLNFIKTVHFLIHIHKQDYTQVLNLRQINKKVLTLS